MADRPNPYSPSRPIHTGVFAGRGYEINRIVELLTLAKRGNPTNALVVGERGIGKSSLLLVAKHLASGDVSWMDKTHNFLTVELSVNKDLTPGGFASRMHTRLRRSLRATNKGAEALKDIWSFVQRLEVGGVGLKNASDPASRGELYDDLALSVADTVKAITSEGPAKGLGLASKKDGLAILIDEGDSAASALSLGAFLKGLQETLETEDANRVLVILAGLPEVRDVLHDSHPSSLRLFEDMELKPLTQDEIAWVVNGGLKHHNDEFPDDVVSIEDEALTSISAFSEGYPHFVQQVAASAFDESEDDVITSDDVQKAMFKERGALDLIGDRYYADLYYNKIKSESYRRILNILAEKWNTWVTRQEIKDAYQGKNSTLNNGIKALRDRHIILSRPGYVGQYRLQWMSFALWIQYEEMRRGNT